MATTYSPNLALALMATGDQAGTWGITNNTNIGTLLEQAITGSTSVIVADNNVTPTTLTMANGTSCAARNMFLTLTGTITAARQVIFPTNNKLYFITNSVTGGSGANFGVTALCAGGIGVYIPKSTSVLVYCNGTDIVRAASSNGVSTNFFVDIGSVNAIAFALTAGQAALFYAGLEFYIQVIATNTGATTIRVTADNIATLVYPGTVGEMLPGQLQAGGIISVMFDGTNFQYLGSIFGSGNFAPIYTGFGIPPPGNIYWTISNNIAMLTFPTSSGLSSGGSPSFNLTNLPSYLQNPNRNITASMGVMVNSGSPIGNVQGSMAAASSTISFLINGNSGSWVGGGSNGFSSASMTYSLL